MTNEQLYLAIGVPLAANVLGLFVLNLINSNINARMTSLETSINTRITSLETRLENRMVSLESSLMARFDLLMGRLSDLEKHNR